MSALAKARARLVTRSSTEWEAPVPIARTTQITLSQSWATASGAPAKPPVARDAAVRTSSFLLVGFLALSLRVVPTDDGGDARVHRDVPAVQVAMEPEQVIQFHVVLV